MALMTIRGLSDGAFRALQVRAVENGTSPEFEARQLLENAVYPEGRLCLGSALAGMSKESGLSNSDVEALEAVRNSNPSPPMWFG